MSEKNRHSKFQRVLPPIRCSEEESTLIKSRASKAGLSMSEYVRRMAVDGQIIVRKSQAKYDFDIVNQLRKIGINLNQQTKTMHIFGWRPDEDHKRIWLKLESVLDDLFLKQKN